LSKRNLNSIGPQRRLIVILSAIVILSVAWSVLLFGFPPGMETGAALILVTPFAMCIIVVELTVLMTQRVKNRHED